jgi:hypothetical protein
MGRQVGEIDSFPRGDALGWENGWAFDPENRREIVSVRGSLRLAVA